MTASSVTALGRGGSCDQNENLPGLSDLGVSVAQPVIQKAKYHQIVATSRKISQNGAGQLSTSFDPVPPQKKFLQRS